MSTAHRTMLAVSILSFALVLGCGKRAPGDPVADDGSAPALIRHRGELLYPDVFPRTRGVVRVLVTIDASGRVSDTEIVEAILDDATNSDAFIHAALEAAENTSFIPSRAVGGYPQSSTFRLTYFFNLSQNETFDPKDVSRFALGEGQEVDVPPKLLHAGFAARPLAILQTAGHVEVEILIDEFGQVYGTKILSSTLEGETATVMHRRVREAALRHQFKPAVKDGKPIACRMRNTVTFEPVTAVHAP